MFDTINQISVVVSNSTELREIAQWFKNTSSSTSQNVDMIENRPDPSVNQNFGTLLAQTLLPMKNGIFTHTCRGKLNLQSKLWEKA